jgi:hypothetical protein
MRMLTSSLEEVGAPPEGDNNGFVDLHDNDPEEIMMN